MIDRTDSPDITAPRLRKLPIARMLPNDPIDPIENAEPIEPIDMTEFREYALSTEFVDR
jgi:hypothetical protein